MLTLTLTHWRVREALTEQHYSRVGETVEALGLALWERLRMADELAAVLLAHPAEALGDDLGVTFDAAILFGPSGATRRPDEKGRLSWRPGHPARPRRCGCCARSRRTKAGPEPLPPWQP